MTDEVEGDGPGEREPGPLERVGQGAPGESCDAAGATEVGGSSTPRPFEVGKEHADRNVSRAASSSRSETGWRAWRIACLELGGSGPRRGSQRHEPAQAADGALGRDVRGDPLPATLDNVRLTKGWFDQTLPQFLACHPGAVAFVHLDADTYGATAYVLGKMADRLIAGSVLQFDEYLGYPGWRHGEFRAFGEFARANRVSYRYLGVGFLACRGSGSRAWASAVAP